MPGVVGHPTSLQQRLFIPWGIQLISVSALSPTAKWGAIVRQNSPVVLTISFRRIRAAVSDCWLMHATSLWLLLKFDNHYFLWVVFSLFSLGFPCVRFFRWVIRLAPATNSSYVINSICNTVWFCSKITKGLMTYVKLNSFVKRVSWENF